MVCHAVKCVVWIEDVVADPAFGNYCKVDARKRFRESHVYTHDGTGGP